MEVNNIQPNPIDQTAIGPSSAHVACLAKYEDCHTEQYDSIMTALGKGGTVTRKGWEEMKIIQALDEAGLLKEGSSGVGFGVGKEPLPSFFASKKVSILATDQEVTSEDIKKDWLETGQLSQAKKDLFIKGVANKKDFDKYVSFEPCDMNAIPEKYYDQFDFAYSSNALGHLGSIEKGFQFIENTLKCVKPGGYVVHTTEFNVGSNDKTVEEGTTVFFRQRDIEALILRLMEKGYTVFPMDFSRGEHPENHNVDVWPYSNPSHMVLESAGQTVTSIVIVAARPIEGAQDGDES